MLTPSDDCTLPCWWGFRPGVTSWEQAQQRFLAYGKRASTWETESLGIGHRISLFGRHRPQPYDYVVEYRLYERENVVQLLGIYGHVPGWPAGSWSEAAGFAQAWEHYSWMGGQNVKTQ